MERGIELNVLVRLGVDPLPVNECLEDLGTVENYGVNSNTVP